MSIRSTRKDKIKVEKEKKKKKKKNGLTVVGFYSDLIS
jgi:hypothetical protein